MENRKHSAGWKAFEWYGRRGLFPRELTTVDIRRKYGVMSQIIDLPHEAQTSMNLLRRRLQSFVMRLHEIGQLECTAFGSSFAKYEKGPSSGHWHDPTTKLASDITVYHHPEDSLLVVWYRYSLEELEGRT